MKYWIKYEVDDYCFEFRVKYYILKPDKQPTYEYYVGFDTEKEALDYIQRDKNDQLTVISKIRDELISELTAKVEVIEE